jgi:predicted restriction endonuclease
MRLARSGGRQKPHKPIMLLAVLDLMQTGEMRENRVYFDAGLIQRFGRLFSVVAKGNDWCQPAPPFFHLRSSGFWFHKPRPGREQAYAQLQTSGGFSKRVVDNIQYAFFDPDSYAVVMDTDSRGQLFAHILSTFFEPEEREKLEALLAWKPTS